MKPEKALFVHDFDLRPSGSVTVSSDLAKGQLYVDSVNLKISELGKEGHSAVYTQLRIARRAINAAAE